MSDRAKKIFLLTTVIGSFVFYCVVYYAQVFHDAPYNLKEFKSFSIRYGNRDNMVNYFNSATGEYDYLNKHDSLIKTHLYLNQADMDTVHFDAAKLNLWHFREDETNSDSTMPGFDKAPRYIIEFVYARKTKKVTFDANYNGPLQLSDANKVLIKDIQQVLSAAGERSTK
jgi:hypothetical protein